LYFPEFFKRQKFQSTISEYKSYFTLKQLWALDKLVDEIHTYLETPSGQNGLIEDYPIFSVD